MYRLMLHLANALAYSALTAAESLHFCIFFQEQIRQTAELFYLMERICYKTHLCSLQRSDMWLKITHFSLI